MPKSLKRKKRLAERIADRADERFNALYTQQCGFLQEQLDRATAATNLCGRVWERCKAAAIEHAAGIA
ncbi:hypothetical protein GCM10011335_52430 [Aureimonas glaciei]|uniref:Uncharacterized protein n=1 Tax=Aureimonas glaciei TaxID=1776957 RepID=A0A917DIS7_9HYPH|nr:hypothetical protein GCM10011335_52430 [Aureimonas glaciei]